MTERGPLCNETDWHYEVVMIMPNTTILMIKVITCSHFCSFIEKNDMVITINPKSDKYTQYLYRQSVKKSP